MHIDPKTKTMDNWIYVKGKKELRRKLKKYQLLKKKKDRNSILSTIN